MITQDELISGTFDELVEYFKTYPVFTDTDAPLDTYYLRSDIDAVTQIQTINDTFENKIGAVFISKNVCIDTQPFIKQFIDHFGDKRGYVVTHETIYIRIRPEPNHEQ